MEKEKSLQKREAVCHVCPHHCLLAEGQTGRCRARKNRGGKIVSINYGRLTPLMPDPIEKKPLRRFFPREAGFFPWGAFGSGGASALCGRHEH